MDRSPRRPRAAIVAIRLGAVGALAYACGDGLTAPDPRGTDIEVRLEERVAVTDAVTVTVRGTARTAVAEAVTVGDAVTISVRRAARTLVDEAVAVADQVSLVVHRAARALVDEGVSVSEDVAITVVPAPTGGWVRDSVLPAAAQYHGYPFPGTAGQAVRIHASLLDDVNGSARMSLLSPTGAVLYPTTGGSSAEGWATSLGSESAVLDLQEDGAYTLLIQSAAPGARYRVGLGTGVGRRDPDFNAVAVPRGTDSGLHFFDMALDGDAIVAVGSRWLRRFNADGLAATGFGTDGAVDLPAVLGGAWGKAVALQPDGRILVAARVTVSPYPWVVARFSPDGVLDPTFGVAGIVTLSGLGTNSDSQPVGIELQSNGADLDIVVAGVAGFNLEKVALVRLKADGSLDPTFGGGDGLVVENGGSGFGPIAFGLDSERRLLVLDDESMRRYLPDGSRDPAFGSDGLVHFTNDLGVTAFARATNFAVVSGDRLAVVGLSSVDAFVMRLQPSGQLDASFAGTGWLTANFGLRDRLQAVVEDAAGNLVVVGHQRTSEALPDARHEFLVARFLANGVIDAQFGHAGYTLDHREANDARAVALDTQGRIVVGGESPLQRTFWAMQIVRLLPH